MYELFNPFLKTERWDLSRGVFQESLQRGPDYLATVLPCYNLSQSIKRLAKQCEVYCLHTH